MNMYLIVPATNTTSGNGYRSLPQKYKLPFSELGMLTQIRSGVPQPDSAI
jgi:hypothetical protein